jgi:glutathione S-transferase
MHDDLVLVGRSSSHFTRTARLFALDLAIPHEFRPVLDLTLLDAANYADNPALKVPILVDAVGPMFGTENICRAFRDRAEVGRRAVLRGDVRDRVVVNAEELTLHVMTSEVSLIMAKIAGDPKMVPAKVSRSIENSLDWLDANVEGALAALPPRSISFLEASLFSLVTHLPWRQVLDVSRWTKLDTFARAFGERESATQTEYRFDAH